MRSASHVRSSQASIEMSLSEYQVVRPVQYSLSMLSFEAGPFLPRCFADNRTFCQDCQEFTAEF